MRITATAWAPCAVLAAFLGVCPLSSGCWVSKNRCARSCRVHTCTASFSMSCGVIGFLNSLFATLGFADRVCVPDLPPVEGSTARSFAAMSGPASSATERALQLWAGGDDEAILSKDDCSGPSQHSLDVKCFILRACAYLRSITPAATSCPSPSKSRFLRLLGWLAEFARQIFRPRMVVAHGHLDRFPTKHLRQFMHAQLVSKAACCLMPKVVKT